MNIILIAAAAASFNLNCAGTQDVQSMFGKTSEPYASIYRIDLVAKKWCEAECKVQHDFASVSATELVLQQKDVDTTRRAESISHLIDRETGDQRILATSGTGRSAIIMNWKGKCVPSAFTGFPKFETQF